jgi:hypothetical protein
MELMPKAVGFPGCAPRSNFLPLDAAFAVVVPEEHIDAHPRKDVVKSVGVLGDATVDINGGAATMTGEFTSDVDDIAFAHAGDFTPADGIA